MTADSQESRRDVRVEISQQLVDALNAGVLITSREPKRVVMRNRSQADEQPANDPKWFEQERAFRQRVNSPARSVSKCEWTMDDIEKSRSPN